MLPFVGFGHSHVVALAKGCHALQQQGMLFGGMPIAGQFHYLYDEVFVPAFIGETGEPVLNPEILLKLIENAPRIVLLSIGGNEHNVLSIIQLYRRYDFILGEKPNLALDANAEIYPEAMIRETVREWMADSLKMLCALRAAADVPMVQFEPPPPLPVEHVLAYPQNFFKKAVDKSKLSSDLLRYKIWRIQAGIYREFCAQIGITYIAVPQELLGKNGTLVQAGWGRDATHANEWFGQRMIEEAMRLLSSQLSV